ncbi:hypothetical protein PG913_00060 [Tenacibaculum pacificus]|uniref:hypothetical protein n=1 Tax=Tenacibaculum pacificus TaxID=3018314 RepID=UPI0022F3FB7E|nr:hypothetical protein [Tenacibaculum pacificus]WBX73698.1 hypothetical protein PG913_00060 [Tenacibaculum pacificus]
MINRILLITLFCFSINLCSQNLNDSWQIGAGIGITKFSESDGDVIGDTNMFQVPVLSLTVPVSKHLSVNSAMSLSVIDNIGIMENSVNYFSIDASLRYNFNAILNKFSPYIFVGGSVVDSELRSTPTLNIGTGGIYWFTNTIGLNPQVYYKYSADSFESMHSHIQATLSLVFKLKSNGSNTRNGSKSRPDCYYNKY